MPASREAAWFAFFVGAAFKSTIVLGAAWFAAFLLRGRSAAARHLVWTAAAAAVLALPFLSGSLPALRLRVASALLPDLGVMFRTTATARADQAATQSKPLAGVPQPARTTPRPPDWRIALMLVWTAGAFTALSQVLAA